MSSAKHLLKMIKRIDYRNMFKITKTLSKKIRKPFLFVLLDIIYCGIAYQAGYYDYQEFEFYNLNRKQRKTYLTRGKNIEIVKRFNDKSSFYKFDNKIEFNKLFNKFLKRDWLYLSNNNIDDFVSFIKSHDYIIVKPIDSAGGKGIEKFTYTTDSEAEKLYSKLLGNNQLLVEEGITQDEKMNVLYDKSVNTLRIFTFY